MHQLSEELPATIFRQIKGEGRAVEVAYTEGGSSIKLLRNSGTYLQNYTALYLRRPNRIAPQFLLPGAGNLILLLNE
jgi:hypothetical protein